MRPSRMLLAAAFLAAVACEPDGSPRALPAASPPCDPGDGVLWGVADLHAHPASELSFAPRGVLWGDVRHGQWADPNYLSALPACPVETHARVSGGDVAGAGAPFDRTAHTLILPLLNAQRGFTHAPIGTRTGDDAGFDAWPNARDVLHQELQLSSLYRAYVGGLRVMVASVTDNQALASLLVGPHFADAFIADRELELLSAARQLDLIVEIAEEHSAWMEVATCPEHARRIVESGRLALLLSLEMEGLSLGQIDTLVARYPIAHILPVHLVDNDFGGTAAFSDIFNASSALLSEMFDGAPLRYLEVEQSTSTRGRLSWPLRIEAASPLPLLYDLGEIDADWYRDLAYDCAAQSCDPGPESATHRTGHVNARGLADGGAAFRSLMSYGVILDVTHMSNKAADDALGLAEEVGYPLIASHGGIGTPGQPVGTERTLTFDLAERLGRTGGMVGLGSEGSDYDRTPLLAARGGPLFTFDSSDAPVAWISTDASPAMTNAVFVDAPRDQSSFEGPAATPVASLALELRGVAEVEDTDARLFAIVELDDCTDATCEERSGAGIRLVREIDTAACASGSCTTSFAFPSTLTDPLASTCEADGAGDPVTFHAWDVRRVLVQTGDRCREEGGPWVVREASMTVDGVPLGDVSFDGGARLFTEGDGARRALVLYDRRDHRWSAVRTPSAPLVHVAMRSGDEELPGAGIGRFGAEVCVGLLAAAPGCTGPGCCREPIAHRGIRGGCPEGHLSINQRGVWQAGVWMEAFARVDEAGDLDRVCGARIEVVGWDVEGGSWVLDEVRVERISDPVVDWIREHRRVSQDAMADAPGAVTFGTDMNGFAPQLPISALPIDWTMGYGSRGCDVSGLDTLETDTGGGRRPVVLEQRGLATYGMLADVMAAISQSAEPEAGEVIDSLFQSADRVIRVWERAREVAAANGSGGRSVRPCEAGP